MSSAPEAVDRSVVAGHKIAFTELPLAVRNRVQQELNNATIDFLREGVERDRTVYAVIYDASGQRREMLLTSDGTVLRHRDLPNVPSSAFALGATRKVTFSELPALVQRTARSQMGAASIDQIDEGTWNGRTAYQITFNRDGQRRELIVGDDGSIVVPSALEITESGRLNEPLRYARTISFNELPLAVQNRLRTEAGSRVDKIERGTVAGRPAYQASFRRNGRPTELRLAEDGSIISNVVAERALSQP